MNAGEPSSFHASLTGSTTGAFPRVTFHPPVRREKDGMALIIFAGGGYARRAEHEGTGYAEFFAAEGFASFVVDYRVAGEGGSHPAMIEDAFAAIETIRRGARKFDIDPHQLGVVGSSAGGHLAAHAMVGWKDYPGGRFLRPDFGILCYPVIHMTGPHAHLGSIRNLLGDVSNDSVIQSVHVPDRITGETPPCFIWHTLGDASVPVENSLDFALALRRKGVPFELHIYQRDGHGLGRKTGLGWTGDCLRWMRELVFLKSYGG